MRCSDQTTKNIILKQVYDGLASINETMKTSYQIKRVSIVKNEDPSGNIYKRLVMALKRHYEKVGLFNAIMQKH